MKRKYKLTSRAPCPASALDVQGLDEDIAYLSACICSTDERDDPPFIADHTEQISETEKAKLCLALGRSTPDGSFKREDAVPVWEWAQAVRVDVAILYLTIKGWMSIKISKGGGLVFKARDPKAILAELQNLQNAGTKAEYPYVSGQEAYGAHQDRRREVLDEEITFFRSLTGAQGPEHDRPCLAEDTPIISKYEEVQLLRAVSRTAPDGAFTQAEAEHVWRWAEGIRLRQVMLDCVLQGRFSLKVRDDGEPLFSTVNPQEILANLEKQQTERT